MLALYLPHLSCRVPCFRRCARQGLIHRGGKNMKGEKTVIAHLNKQRKNELSAINEHFLHARMLDPGALNSAGKHEYDESIGVMKHAERLNNTNHMLHGRATSPEVQ